MSLSLLPAVLAALLAQARPTHAPGSQPRSLHVLIINGGGNAQENFKSHLLHLQEMTGALEAAGVPRAQISILASDGADPQPDVAARGPDPDAFWLLHGTGLERWLGEPVVFENTTVPGMTVAPATRSSVSRWFQAARARLRPGDTLLIYVTDHGKDDARDPRNNRITLWGPREGLSVRQLAAELSRLPAGVRTVSVMSQCFSGGFAHLLDVRPADEALPSGAACGYFATTADRPAYGCYPEATGTDRVGHGFAVIAALAAGASNLRAVHSEVLVHDHTPDVPLRTVDSFLADRLSQGARLEAGSSNNNNGDRTAFIDRYLVLAGKQDAVPELALAEQVARSFGVHRPRTLAAAAEARAELARERRQADAHHQLWETALSDMTRAHYQRLLAEQPDWSARLRPRVIRNLGDEARRALTNELLAALGDAADRHPGDRRRLRGLMDKADAASNLVQRLDAREAALLRLEILLTSAAGRAYLATRGTRAELSALAALEGCEDLALPRVAPGKRKPAPAPLPPLAEDHKLLETLHPSWLGIAFQGVSPAARARFRLGDGAALVTGVQPGSPAQSAGLQPGDIVVGQVGAPFERANQIRSFTMLSPRGKPLELEALRRGARKVVKVTLAAYPARD